MDAEKKKAIVDAYKTKAVEGGIYMVECTANGKKWIKSTKNLTSIKNRFEFQISINSCPEPDMREEWNQYGGKAFVFSVLETLKKGENQTPKEYADDLEELLEMCKEKE